FFILKSPISKILEYHMSDCISSPVARCPVVKWWVFSRSFILSANFLVKRFIPAPVSKINFPSIPLTLAEMMIWPSGVIVNGMFICSVIFCCEYVNVENKINNTAIALVIIFKIYVFYQDE